MNERPSTSPMSRSRSTPPATTAQAASIVGRDAEHPRGVVAAPARQDPEHRAGELAQDADDAADEPVAAERDRRLAGRGGAARRARGACSRSRVTSVWKRTPSVAQRALGAGQELRRAPAPGGRIAQQGDVAIHRVTMPRRASRAARRSRPGSDRARPRRSRGPMAPVSTIAPSMPALCAAPRSASTRSPTMSARPGPSRSSAVCTSVGSGLPIVSTVRPEAYSTAAMIAPEPGHRPSELGKVASRLEPSRKAPRSAACVASRSSS